MSIIDWWYIQQYITQEKNATPFSFRKEIAFGNTITDAGYRASDLVQYRCKEMFRKRLKTVHRISTDRAMYKKNRNKQLTSTI